MLMENITFELSIPLDEDGFIELECDFCKTRFMVTGDDFQNKDILHLFCPICGLPNDLVQFYCPEVIEKAEQMALEWAMDEIQRQLGSPIRNFNKGGFKIDIQTPPKEPPKELYTPVNFYINDYVNCCDSNIKIHVLDKEIGVYCPICGRVNL